MRCVRTSALALALLAGTLGACRSASIREATGDAPASSPSATSATSATTTMTPDPRDAGSSVGAAGGEIRVGGSVVAGAASVAAADTIVGSGALVTEARPLSGFRALEVGTVGLVQVDVTGRESVEVAADDNVVGLVRTEVVGGRLVVGLAERTSLRNVTVRLRVEAAALDEVVVHGSADVEIGGLAGPRFNVALRGAGDAQVSGAAEDLVVDVEGSGNVRAADLVAQRATVRISGSGDVALPAVQSLSASIEGSGDVTYRGRPAAITRSVSGSGEVRPG